MKKVIFGIILALVPTVALANDSIYSPRGISQSAWQTSAEYLTFQCPDGFGRSEGIDMNFTTDRSDDFYFVTCTEIVPFPTQTITQSDTPTATVSPTPAPTTSDTSTATSSTSTSSSGSTSTSGGSTSSLSTDLTATKEFWLSFYSFLKLLLQAMGWLA